MKVVGCKKFIILEILIFSYTTLPRQSFCAKENSIIDALRNYGSRSRGKSQNNSNEMDQLNGEESGNVLKIKAQEMLKKCGSENNKSGDTNKRANNNNNNNGSRNNRNNENNENGDDDGEWNSHNKNKDIIFSYRDWNNNNNGNNYHQPEKNYNNGYGNNNNNHRNQQDAENSNNNNGYRRHNIFEGFDTGNSNNGFEDCDTTRNSKPSSNGYNPYSSYNNYEAFSRRQKRSANNYFNREEKASNENNLQCISQCVFGYLHLLDAERTPSEFMLIRWLQNNVNGNNTYRIKALREARKCFATITTRDLNDGCEISSELSKCLELELE